MSTKAQLVKRAVFLFLLVIPITLLVVILAIVFGVIPYLSAEAQQDSTKHYVFISCIVISIVLLITLLIAVVWFILYARKSRDYLLNETASHNSHCTFQSTKEGSIPSGNSHIAPKLYQNFGFESEPEVFRSHTSTNDFRKSKLNENYRSSFAEDILRKCLPKFEILHDPTATVGEFNETKNFGAPSYLENQSATHSKAESSFQDKLQTETLSEAPSEYFSISSANTKELSEEKFNLEFDPNDDTAETFHSVLNRDSSLSSLSHSTPNRRSFLESIDEEGYHFDTIDLSSHTYTDSEVEEATKAYDEESKPAPFKRLDTFDLSILQATGILEESIGHPQDTKEEFLSIDLCSQTPGDPSLDPECEDTLEDLPLKSFDKYLSLVRLDSTSSLTKDICSEDLSRRGSLEPEKD